MELSADLVGARMVLRSIVPGQRGPSGGPALTDVVGRMLEHRQGAVTIERRDGSLVEVDLALVVSARRVPDGAARVRTRPAADFTADELSRICTRGWPPTIVEPLGQWQLRAAGGFTGRANSVAVHGDPGLPFEAALGQVRAFYAAHRLPVRAQVVVGSHWEPAFEAAGWVGVGGTHDHAVVQVADLREVRQQCGPADSRVGLAADVDDDWLGLLERGTAFPRTDLLHVLSSPPTVAFARLGRAGGQVEAIARVVVTGEWAGLSCVHTVPGSRRRGRARTVMDASVRWAAERGADKIYLQTMSHNEAALAMYASYGFADHHTYRYLTPRA